MKSLDIVASRGRKILFFNPDENVITMIQRRADSVTETLTDNTVMSDLFGPIKNALAKVRFSDKIFQSLSMESFMLFAAIRQFTQNASLREHVQQLWHCEPSASRVPLARSTWSDALSSSTRRIIVRQCVARLVSAAREALPNKLAGVQGLGSRPVLAIDATYQKESSHFQRVLPKEGGSDNQKGHMLMTAYDIRHGIPVCVRTEAASIGEMSVLKMMGEDKQDWTRIRNAIYVVDRAFIDGQYWEDRQTEVEASVITRMKATLNYTQKAIRPLSESACNENVINDYEIELQSGKLPWRLVEWRSPEGEFYQYLTNDFSLEPGVVAFLYYRRWDVEKYFDNFKHDLVNAKAWGKSACAIELQALLGLMTYVLTMLFLLRRKDDLAMPDGDMTQSKKHARKMALYLQREDIEHENEECDDDACDIESGEKNISDYIYPDAYRAFYTQLSRITRQIWRFLKYSFRHKSSQTLYERQLKPLLMKYL